MAKTVAKFPNTKFQRWLAAHDACAAGRKSVGNKTYEQFVRTTRNQSYLHWLKNRHPDGGIGCMCRICMPLAEARRIVTELSRPF